MEIVERFIFSGHVIGASAHFHKLDNLENIYHPIPVLGSAVVPIVGGLAQHKVENFSYTVDEPRRRTLLAARHVEARAHGREYGDRYETEIETQVRGLSVLEKLHVDLVELKQKAISTKGNGAKTPSIRTTSGKIEGLQLGKVTAFVELDREPFEECDSKRELLEFVSKKGDSYKSEHGWRFSDERNGYVYATLVKKIRLEGPPEELAVMKVHDNVITWDGFGKIFLGEVIIRDEDRRVTMMRLQMGSDGGGSGTAGCGHTNGGGAGT